MTSEYLPILCENAIGVNPYTIEITPLHNHTIMNVL